MIQFLKNIWYAQRNARCLLHYMKEVDICDDLINHFIESNLKKKCALAEIARSNPKNTNGTVRKHVRIARDALGWRNRC